MAKKTRKEVVYNSSLGRVIARGARQSRMGRFHVISSISNEGKWSLVSEGSKKPIRAFTTKNAAVSFAKRSNVGRSEGHVIIHGKDGRIQNKISFQTQD